MPVEFNNNSIKIKEAISNAATAFLEEAGGMIKSQAQINSRVDTGKTKGDYQYKVVEESDGGTVYVGSNNENAIWEEFGTGEYALKGNGRKGGWSYQDEKGEWHHTLGKTPTRALFNAFNFMKGKLKKRLQQVLKDSIGG